MRKIKIKDIGRFTEEQFEKVIRFAVLELDARLKEGSPVDTGRFRGSWQISQNSKSAPVLFGPFQNTEALPRSALPPIRTNYVKEKTGNTYTILNNLPYAEAVTYGTNLPRSWGGSFRTRNDKRAGWPDPQVRTVSILISKIKPKE
tara:strand:+ start:235 stop:672 length:438 start_codon:yes stop_codon:yes gene_type:complete